MEENQVVAIRSVEVRFLEGLTHKRYVYRTDLELLPNELVVVESPTRGGYALARVEIMNKYMDPKAHKWVVGRVDVAAHEARRAQEEALKEVDRLLERRRKAIEAEEVYREYAKTDPVMRELVAQRDQLRSMQVTSGGRSFTAVIPPRVRPAGEPIRDNGPSTLAETGGEPQEGP